MLLHRFAATLCVTSALLVPMPALAQSIGTTVAVVPDAYALGITSTPQVIELGDQVISNQTVETDANGLVQILLADGTSFTVGPNSSLVIDSFVYDPATDTASLAATASRGFLRFIGGASSKSENGATITTPVGTAGIRGAIVDISASGQDGLPPGVSLVFGSTLSLTLPNGTQQVITEPGQTIFVANGTPSIVPTPPQLAGQFASIVSAAGSAGPSPIVSAQIGQAIQALPPAQTGGPSAGAGGGNFAALNQMVSAIIQGAQASENVQIGTVDRITNPGTPEPAEPPPEEPPVQYQGHGFGTGIGSFAPVLGPVEIRLNPSTSTVEGRFEDSWGLSPEVFAFAPGDSSVAPDGTFTATNEQGTLQSSSQPLCSSCAFMEWGTWSTTDQAPDQIENGHWVLGDQTTAQQLEGLTGSAGYAGNAVGHASGGGVTGIADGTFTASMNFGTGSGWIEFADFGNSQAGRRDFGVDVEFNETGRSFTGVNFTDPTESSPVHGDLQGGFANEAADYAKGIMGAFNASAPLDDWFATGVFAGSRLP